MPFLPPPPQMVCQNPREGCKQVSWVIATARKVVWTLDWFILSYNYRERTQPKFLGAHPTNLSEKYRPMHVNMALTPPKYQD